MKTYAGIGSRQTPLPVRMYMTKLAAELALRGYTLRSGHASGADQAFEAGAGRKAEIYLPKLRFNGSRSTLLPSRDAFKMAEKYHPAWGHCDDFAKACHARNCHQILGRNLDDPVEFVVCWTPYGDRSGGTGQALRVATAHGIYIRDLGIEEWARP